MAISEVVLCSVFSHSSYHNNLILLGTYTNPEGLAFAWKQTERRMVQKSPPVPIFSAEITSFSHPPVKWDPPGPTCASTWTLLQHRQGEGNTTNCKDRVQDTASAVLLHHCLDSPRSCRTAATELTLLYVAMHSVSIQ